MKIMASRREVNYLARLAVFLTAAALVAGMVGCDSGGQPPSQNGGQPPSQDLEIETWYDLDAVRNNLAGHHILMNDLDSKTAGYQELASPTANGGRGWDPIGVSDYDAPFIGSLDGGGYEIRDLFINRPDKYGVGLFSAVGGAGVVQDIGVVNFTVAGYVPVGALVGWNGGFVVKCYCTMGNVTGDSDVGGLVGYSERFVVNSYYNCDEVLINGQHGITVGALFDEGFEEWLANDKFLDVNERLSQESGYYVVNNVKDLKELLAFGEDDTLRFRLTNDLDLAGEPNFYIPYLAGEFDGNGHKISNLSFNFSFVSKVGLFGQLASDGTVHDVAAENINIAACSHVGGLVGWNEGGVSDSYFTGSVTGDEHVGGLVGYNLGTVSSCHSTIGVTGDEHVGGLVGQNHRGNVSNSCSTGSVTGREAVGGLVGVNYNGIVSNSYYSGSVAGGYVVGGLVGANAGDVRDCYSTGSVTGEDFIGGLAGANGNGKTVTNCYSTGSVTCAGNVCLEVGGLVTGPGIVSASFWDIQTSGQAASDAGAGKTAVEMKRVGTFSDADWNIVTVGDSDTRNPSYIWNIVDGVTYPFLSWQAI